MRILVRGAATLALGFATAVAVGFAAGPGAAREGSMPTLYVNYTMNCTFAISDDAGNPVTSIAPGTYQVEVNTPVVFGGVYSNGSSMTACNGFVQFQLTGPGVNLSTTLDNGDLAEEALVATFAPSSTYTAQDNNQPSVAVATFTTLASAPGAATGPPKPTATVSGSGSTSSSAGTSSSKGTATSGHRTVPDRDQMTALFTVDHYQGSSPSYTALMRYATPFQKILAGCRINANVLTNTIIDLADQASTNGGRDVTALDMLQAIERRIAWKGRKSCTNVFDVAEAVQETGKP